VAVAVRVVHHEAMSGEPLDRITPMTDEEAALFRLLRYGQLPEPIRPEQLVPVTDPEPLGGMAPLDDQTESWNRRY